MKIVEQSHEILHMDGIDRIEIAGRTCYKSEDKITEKSSERFARMLVKKGHGAMLEHASATVKLITDRGVTHELVRHRMASFGQESTRYVNYGGDDMQFVLPVLAEEKGEALFFFERACWTAEDYYKELLGLGWQPEQARSVLPNSLKTEIVVTANFREWRHIFKLRVLGTTGRPHPQIKALLKPVLAEFVERCPAVFGDLVS